MRIVFLGASLTEGVYGGNFVAGVAKLMPQHEIINMGVSGSTINRLLDRLDDALGREPDAAFVMAGSNDAIAYSQPATRPYYKSQQNLPEGFIPPAAFGQMYRDLLAKLQLHYVRPLVGLPPLEHNPELAGASNLFNQQTVEAVRAYNVPILDLNPYLMPATIPPRPPLSLQTVFQIGDRVRSGWNDYETEHQRGGYTYSFDGIHFMPETAEKVAGIVAAWLTEQLD
ncbi:MAG TPA: SGNH/GDSL hydrolase family protein [Phototrophicaceae bacterium]|jgi:lysophospholipase L1-like esterase|nr:SGNH/GDSL hydrolase family protein [Phototrophicaceae bacterium]